jgi:hypothetical protein
MDLFPLSPGLGRQPCPFCGAGPSGAGASGAANNQGGMFQVSLGGNPVAHGHLLITTADGRRIGYLNGKLVNDINGATVVVPFLNNDFLAHPEPLYQLPADVGPIRITLDGVGATGSDAAQVHVTGPGFGATISNLVPRPGSLYQLSVAARGSSVSLRASGANGQRAVIQLGLNGAHGGPGSTLSSHVVLANGAAARVVKP